MQPFTINEYKQTYLSKERLASIYRHKWFKLFIPEANGGLELSLKEGLKVLVQTAEIQGGLGWTINLGAGANWFSGFFNEEAAKEIFMPLEAVIAGSGFASGTWKEENGLSYEINGTWSRCTGAKHATFFSLNAKDNSDQLKTFVVPAGKIKLSDEKWKIFGLRNTSSYAIDIDHQSIPLRYSFRINEIKNPNAYLVHEIPFETFARLCMSASFIGIVKCFIRNCVNHPLNQMALKCVEKDLQPLMDASETNCFDWSEKISEVVLDQKMTDDLMNEMKSSLGNFNLELYNHVQQLFFHAGLPVVEEDTLVHWSYRDVLTAAQHYMVKP